MTAHSLNLSQGCRQFQTRDFEYTAYHQTFKIFIIREKKLFYQSKTMKENWKGLNSQEVQYRRALFSGCEGAEVNHQFSLTLDAQLSMFGHTYNPHTCHSTNYICNCHLYPYQQSYYILSIIKQQKYITSLPTMLLLTASLPRPPKELLKLRGQCW